MCEKKEKTVKEVKMHKFLVCAYKSQDFAQSEKNFCEVARLEDHEIQKICPAIWRHKGSFT